MASGNWKTALAIMSSLLIAALNCNAEPLSSDVKSIEQENQVDENAGRGEIDNLVADLQKNRENMLNFYQGGLLTEFSRIIDHACDYFGRLRLITENGEIDFIFTFL